MPNFQHNFVTFEPASVFFKRPMICASEKWTFMSASFGHTLYKRRTNSGVRSHHFWDEYLFVTQGCQIKSLRQSTDYAKSISFSDKCMSILVMRIGLSPWHSMVTFRVDNHIVVKIVGTDDQLINPKTKDAVIFIESWPQRVKERLALLKLQLLSSCH